MKKLLFIIRDFKQGGIPRALQSILQQIDTNKYHIDLFCMHQLGPYNGNMQNCNVIKQDKLLYHLLQFRKDYKNNPITYFYKFINQIYIKLIGKSLIDYRLTKIAKSLSGKYDAVIAYSGGISSELAQQIKGSKRFIWIHNDYAFEPARDDQKTDFNKFDNIVCVSESAKKSFEKLYPQLTTKTIAIYNIINDNFIRESTKQLNQEPFDSNYFNIVSVGRICWQKNFKVIPWIIASISPEIRNRIRWYIIGNGSDEAEKELKDEIGRFNVENQCIMTGPKSNPYSYLKNADLFVLTSIHESFCLVIHEARSLGTPVVSVPIPVIEELLGKEVIYPLDKIAHHIESNILIHNTNKNPFSYEEHNRKVMQQLDLIFN